MMMMVDAPPVAVAADHHWPIGRNDEIDALLLWSGAVVELVDPPSDDETVCSKACTNGKKGIDSRLSELLYIMAFSPHSTFRPAVRRKWDNIERESFDIEREREF